ncbi:hypothetical protein [Rhizobium rhizogenes]|nr:hypothetical protein [Rhizobium rhizogenes]NTG06469.1 hypothetical protein [Rhizobium rhizogenes]
MQAPPDPTEIEQKNTDFNNETGADIGDCDFSDNSDPATTTDWNDQ